MPDAKVPTYMLSRYHAVENEITNDELPKRNLTRPRKWRLLTLFWFWEVIATIASAACMMAVIIILARMQSKSLGRWTISISLNATIAIFITAAKSLSLLVIGACIAQLKWIRFRTSARKLQEFDLFENAARGPLGSLMLLLQVRWHSGLASIGAIVTILALGVDTFAQQVVRLDTRELEVVDGKATFRLSLNYTGGAKWLSPIPVDIEAKSVDVAMEGAMFRGIYNMTSDPQFMCSSRCIWKDPYISLGFASRCEDVTAPTLASISNVNMTASYNSGTYNMTTPGKINLGMDFDPLYRTQINIVATGFRAGYGSYNIPFPADFVHVVVARRFPNAPAIGPNDEYDLISKYFGELEVVECAIGFSAYNYTSASAFGNQLDMRVSHLKLDPGTSTGNRPHDSHVLYNQTGVSVFQVEEADIQALINLFESPRFSGKMSTGQTTTTPPSGVVMALVSPNISQTFDNMALSMTEQLRSRGDESGAGYTIISEVSVRIRWAWLTLPICVTLIAALLLLATWLNTRLHHCIPWKSSATAILYHHVVTEGGSEAILRSEMKNLDEMEDAAKTTRAKLE
ncbi:hypothetical protein BKA66DRAFT_553015 [Pyrenochaeta sp. MPI-SDFR-AT-0127]|nr:hypothetical protein BKA66DRAFT_553015 [Pyrenochaeta sp. MPI-SDFR-AT-0127]